MNSDTRHPHSTGAHLSEDRLIDLVHDLVDEATRERMLEHLSSCTLCEEHLRLLVREHESLRTRPAPRIENGRVVLPGRTVRAARARSPRHRARWFTGGLVAAAAVAVFVAVNLMRPDVSGASYWLPTPPPNAVEAGGLEPLDEALRAYDEHDPARAAALLENARIPSDDRRTEAIRRLYQASALVNAGRPGEALDVLDGADAHRLEEPWRTRAEWVRYLALREAGRRDEARAQLRRIERLHGDREIGRRLHDERERLFGD